MPQKSVLQTLSTLIVWLFLQNFNYAYPITGNFDHNVDGIDPVRPQLSYKIKRVVLDAGHGGKDPGCIGIGKNQEKHNTLAIVLALGAKIEEAFPDIEVIYTRKTDVFIELNERAAIANRNNADLFISVHCNAMSVSSSHGAETYVMGLHTAAHNLEVAKRENASIYLEDNYKKNYEGYDPDSPEAHIIGSVWQSSYLEQSILLAQQVQYFSNKIAGRVDRGVKQAGFLVLRETAMPSVLVEAGYLTNKKEDEYLVSDEGRNDMAESIFQAFKAYKVQMEDKVPAKNEVAVKKTNPAPEKQPVKTVPAPVKTQPATAAQQKTTTPPQPKPVAAAQKQPVNTAPVKTEPAHKTTATTTAASKYQILLLSWPGPLDRNTGRLALLSNVTEEKAGSEYKYYYGPFANKDEAEKMLPELKNMGFKTAKIETAKSGK
jgi:N-acetylmuramoyl-L-alanine amidase